MLSRAILAGVLSGLLAACDSPPADVLPDGTSPASDRAALAAARPSLPDLSAMDPAVTEQIRRRHGTLIQRLEDPNATSAELARAFGELGAIYRAYRFIPRARTCYATAAAEDPDEVRWTYVLGHLERTAGNLAASDAAFQKALELSPGDVPTLVWLAENAFDQNRLDAAHDLFLEALARQSDCVKAHFGLARIALEHDELQAAVEHLEEARLLQDDATPIHYTLGLAWSRAGDPERASAFFDRVPDNDLARVPIAFDDPLMREVIDLRASAQSHAQRAQKAISQRRYEVAIGELERAVAIDPERPDTRYNLAASLLLVKRVDEARGHLEQLVESNPDYVQGYLLLARVFAVAGDLAAAEDLLRRAHDLDPQVAAGPLAEVQRLMNR